MLPSSGIFLSRVLGSVHSPCLDINHQLVGLAVPAVDNAVASANSSAVSALNIAQTGLIIGWPQYLPQHNNSQGSIDNPRNCEYKVMNYRW